MVTKKQLVATALCKLNGKHDYDKVMLSYNA